MVFLRFTIQKDRIFIAERIQRVMKDRKKRKDGFKGERGLVLPGTVVSELEKDPLASTLHITDIGYYPHAQDHYIDRPVAIPQYVFIYCIEGKDWFRFENETYEVHANQYFILPAGKPHSYGSDENDPWTIYWIHFKGKLAGQYAAGLNRPTDIKPTVNSRISNRIDLFEEIYNILEMGYSKENMIYASSVFYHFLGSVRYLQQYRSAFKRDKGDDDIVTAAIHYMKENIEKKISLQELSEHTGYSPSHFSMLFSKQTGYAPARYFNQLKIQKACQLLDFTEMKINQICHKIGIEDCYYLSRLFKNIMGMSPREYKKLKKG